MNKFKFTKRLICVIVCLTVLVGCVSTLAAAGPTKTILNETYNNVATNGVPPAATVRGSGSIVRVIEGGSTGKALLVRNRWKNTSVTYEAVSSEKNTFISARVQVNDGLSKKAVISAGESASKLLDLVSFMPNGDIADVNGEVVGKYSTGAWYKVTVKLNSATGRYEIYVNDELKANRILVPAKSVAAVGFISYANESRETKMVVDWFRVYSADEIMPDSVFSVPAINTKVERVESDEVTNPADEPAEEFYTQDFESANVGTTPSGISTKNTPVSVAEDSEAENKYYFLNRNNGTEEMYADVTFSRELETAVFEGDFMVTEKSTNTFLYLFRDTNAAFSNCLIVNSSGLLTLHTGASLGVNLKNNWTNIKLIADFGNKTFTVYVNDELKAQDIVFQNPNISQNIMLARFNIRSGGGEDTLGIDNLRFYTGVNIVPKKDETEEENGGQIEAPGTDPEKENSAALTPDLTKFHQVTEYEINNPSGYFEYTYASGRGAFKDNICFLADNKRVWLKDKLYDMDNNVIIDDGTILVPARGIAAATGLSVLWNPASAEVTIGDNIKVKSGDMFITVGGKTIPTPVPVQNREGITYIPMKQLVEEGLRKYYFESYKGLAAISDSPISVSDDKNLSTIINMVNYIMFDRPSGEYLITLLEQRFGDNPHPRTIITKDDVQRLKELVATNEKVEGWSNNVIGMADSVVAGALPKQSYDTAGLRMSGFTGVDSILNLYWAYQMTGDEKYPKTAEAHGLAMAAFGPGTHHNWNSGQHFLETSAAIAANGLIIDLFYDQISQESKDTIANAIIEYGIKPARDHYYGTGKSNWPQRSNNWNIVCNAGTIIGALCLLDEYETELCADVIEKALKSSEYMMHSYAPEGAWEEGPSYWHYTVSNNVMMCAALQSVFGTDFGVSRAPGFMNTAYFPIMLTGNAGYFAYHDSTPGNFVNSPEMWWFANKNQDADLAQLRLDNMEAKSYRGNIRDLMWYYEGDLPEEVHMPLDKRYKYTEVATMRSDWGQSAAFVALHAGNNNVPHGQLDAGTFEYEVLGTRFASEMGADDYNMPNYFSIPSAQYYVGRAEGHNVYVINPGSGPDQEVNTSATIESVVSKPKGAIYTVDLTSAYKKNVVNAQRGFMLTQDRKVFVVQDEITPSSTGDEYYWFWHTTADIEIGDDGRTVKLNNGGKEVTLYFDSNVDFTIESGKSLPLETSPQHPQQLRNLTRLINKITVRFESGYDDISFRAVAVPQGTRYMPGEIIPISDWAIPDGEIDNHYDYLDEILVDGVPLEGFAPKALDYTIRSTKIGGGIPTVSATSEHGAVTIRQATADRNAATIEVQSSTTESNITIYTIDFVTTTSPGLPTSGTKLAPKEINVSDEPQPENPRTNAIDGDFGTRYAVQGRNCWIEYDLGARRDLAALAIAIYQGAARVQYFTIEVSDDGENYKSLAVCQTSGTSIEHETISLEGYSARYVRLVLTGTSVGDWNSITELEIYVK